MLIPVRNKNHELSFLDVPNFEYLPLFYQFPKELLQQGASYLQDMPRNPRQLLNSPQWRETLVSDAFLSVLLDGAAYLVWPAFEVKAHLESFSGYDPLWKMARAIPWWTESLGLLTHSQPTDLFLLGAEQEMPWLTVEHATMLFPVLAQQAIERYHLRPVIEAIKEMRCIEDYDERPSRAKIDFYRKWYHSQTKHPIVSWEGLLNPQSSDEADEPLDRMLHAFEQSKDWEDCLYARLDMEAFLETLTRQEREIVELRKEGLTQNEIAKRLGYNTHSAICKRIAVIEKRYRDFAALR